MNYQAAIDWVDNRITESPGKVILAFLLVTAVFFTGLGSIESESGQDQFIEDLPSFEAFEDIQRNFNESFSESDLSTTVIVDSQNALSKQGLLRTLRGQERLEEYDPLIVISSDSPAETVARELEPNASSVSDMILAVESATPGEIDRAVRSAADGPVGLGGVSDDFNARAASATAVEMSITHEGPEEPNDREEKIRRVLSSVDGKFRVLGDAPDTNTTSLLIVMPGALFFITLFLIVAYRDLIDLLIGLVSIIMALIWTFGFLGLAGIPFSVLIVAVPPLLIAVGIDFGIHSVNRYREETVKGKGIVESMKITTDQLLVAFFIVTGTSTIGFLSNLVSAFPPIRDFGLAAAVGISFTFLIFGVFLPAAKVYVDRSRESLPIPQMGSTPLGSDESPLGKALSVGVVAADKAPVALLVVMVASTGAVGVYASGVDTGFESDDFLPAEETPDYLQNLPEPFRPPAEYQYVKNDNFRDRKFDQTDEVLMYVQGPMERNGALDQIGRVGKTTPPTFERENGRIDDSSVIGVIDSVAERDPRFAELVERNDGNGDGIPENNLDEVYDSLDNTPSSGVSNFISEDRDSARVVYSVDSDASDTAVTEDAYRLADRYRYDAQPTGFAVFFQEATDLIFTTIVESLVLTLVGAALFLIAVYWVLKGEPALGIVNTFPILTTVVLVVATMRYFGISFNAINGSIVAITIGLGIDYSVHVVHRFADEFEEKELIPALRRTVIGTGGALTGSMLTTVFGVGVIGLAVNPALAVFGILTASSVFYAYLTSLFVLPTVVVAWERLVGFR
ncbi:MAG: efflux RND transporter permease subunit [Halobacteria archaeon]